MPDRGWPPSHLDAAEHAFTLLIKRPTPMAFDGRDFDGLPDQILPLEDLRRLLLAPATAEHVRDAVWRELVTRARRGGPAWVVCAVNMALPGLRATAGQLTAGWHGDTADLDSELLTGFLCRLKTVDLDAPRICGRLIEAGLRAARKARDQEADTHLIRANAAGPIAPIQPWDHPELVLARAVAAGVIKAEEANLIAATRLGETTLARAAELLGRPPSTLGSKRARAERKLAAAIADGDLAFVPLRLRQHKAGGARVGRMPTTESTSVGDVLANNATMAPVLVTC